MKDVAKLLSRFVRMQSFTGTDYTKSMYDLAHMLDTEFKFPYVAVVPGDKGIIARASEMTELAMDIHFDTVSVGDEHLWSNFPCSGQITKTDDDIIIHGRGAMDDKAFLAGVLQAVKEIGIENVPGLALSISGEEESTMQGIEETIRYWKEARFEPPKDVVVWEPCEGNIGHTHKGTSSINVIVKGKSGHSSIPSECVNPIYYATKFMQEIDKLNENVLSKVKHEDYILSKPVLANTTIHAGDADNAIPDICKVTYNYRCLPSTGSIGFGTGWLIDHMEEMGKRITEGAYLIHEDDISISFEVNRDIPAFHVSKLAPIVDFSKSVYPDAKISPLNFATHAAKWQQHWEYLNGKGYDPSIVVVGDGSIPGQNCHSIDEYCTGTILNKITETAKEYMTGICSPK